MKYSVNLKIGFIFCFPGILYATCSLTKLIMYPKYRKYLPEEPNEKSHSPNIHKNKA